MATLEPRVRIGASIALVSVKGIHADELALPEPISDAERDAHLQLAVALNGLAWRVAKQPNRSSEDYRRAFARIMTANKLAPSNDGLNTAAMALVRIREYERALTVLGESRRAFGSHDYAVSALAHIGLGNIEQAVTMLENAKDAVAENNEGVDEDLQMLLEEIELAVASDKK